MNIYQKVQAGLLAAHIEYHWWWILHLRKVGEGWLSCGESLSSPRLLRLNACLDRHGLAAKRYARYYEEHCTTSVRPEKRLSN